MDSIRISPSDVAEKRRGGEIVLLVCAYDNGEKCRGLGIPELMPLHEFEKRLPSLAPESPVVFVCG